MDTTITKLLGNALTIELHDIPPHEMELFKNCFVSILEMRPHLIFPGQMVIHFNKDGKVMKIYVSGLAWKRKKT